MQQVNSEEQDRVDRHLAVQAELQANMGADSLDSELAVSAYSYHLKDGPNRLEIIIFDMTFAVQFFDVENVHSKCTYHWFHWN